MHEGSIAQYSFDIIKETIKTNNIEDKKIKSITFVMGKPNTVMPAAFEFYFTELIKGSMLEGVKLNYKETNLEGFFVDSIEVED